MRRTQRSFSSETGSLSQTHEWKRPASRGNFHQRLHNTCAPGDRTLPTGAVHERRKSESPGPPPVRSLLGRRGCCARARGSGVPSLHGGSWRSRTQEVCRQGLRVQKSLMSSRSEPVQLQDLWGQDAMQAMQPPCEAELPSVTPALAPRDELPTPEPWRRLFHGLCYWEAEGPQKICSRLRELCRRWLEPQRRSKEQMLELVVLEQFLAILPPEMQSWVCGHCMETCAQAVALAEGFQLGQVEDETLQLTARVEVEEASSDKMQPPGALPEPGDSWVQQPKARGEDRPLEEAGDRETPGPEDELPHVAKEQPAPNPEPGAGTLSRADLQPPEAGAVNLELQRRSAGSRGRSGSLTPGPGQLQEGQGTPGKQGESMELQEVFEDVAVYFTREQWELLEEEDKGLYRDQMLRNYRALVSLGYRGPAPDLICRIQRGEVELWDGDDEDRREIWRSEDLRPGAGTLSRADLQPPEEGAVNLELQRPSAGRRGQSGSLTPGLSQLQEGQGRPDLDQNSGVCVWRPQKPKIYTGAFNFPNIPTHISNPWVSPKSRLGAHSPWWQRRFCH